MKGHTNSFLFPVLTVSIALLASSGGQAIEVGECSTPKEMTGALKNEGHKIVASMNRYGYSVDNKEWQEVAYLVTAKPDMSDWYLVRGDRPLAEKSTSFCIAEHGSNLEVNDYRQDRPATVSTYDFDEDSAIADCQQLIADNPEQTLCGAYSQVSARYRQEYAMGLAVQGQTDQDYLLSIFANPNGDQKFDLFHVSGTGAMVLTQSGRGFSFSPAMQSALQ